MNTNYRHKIETLTKCLQVSLIYQNFKIHRNILLCLINRCIVDTYFNVLSVVTEGLSEDSETAHMSCIVVNTHFKADAASVVEVKAVNSDIGNF